MQKQKKPQVTQAFERLTEDKPRRHFESKAEEVVVNFTKIPEYLLELLLKGPQNYTDLNHPDVKKKLEHSMNASDQKDATIADLRRQLNLLRNDEAEARSFFQQEGQQKKQTDAEMERQKAERQKRAYEKAPVEVTTKQKRGLLYGAKRRKTVETAAAFGKQ